MDRVDRAEHCLRILDYKSGGIEHRERRLTQEFAGRELQLGHYALAFALTEPGTEVDAAYYSIKEAKYSSTLNDACEKAGTSLAAFLAADELSRRRARELSQPNLPNLIEDALGEARAGRFPVAPGDCRYCELRAACRVGGFYEEWE